MNRLQKASVAVACILCSVLFLALSIDAVGEVPTLKEFKMPNIPSLPDIPLKPNPDTTKLDQRTEEGASEPLMRVHGPVETSYLRLVPYDRYLSGTWETLKDASTIYKGGNIDLPVKTYLTLDEVNFIIEPLSELGQYLPTAPNTVNLNLTDSVSYISDKQVFTSAAPPQAYSLTYFRFTFSEEQLSNAQAEYILEYLEVPSYLQKNLKALSEKITAEDTTPYRKLVSLRDYLKDNYEYNMNFPQAPPGTDPLEYFLFESREGVCIHFNTALTMMARVLGIPARLVGGYMIDPDELLQEVYPIQQHAFTEVPFQGMGWIIFDATPGVDTTPDFDVVQGDEYNNSDQEPPEFLEKLLDPLPPPSDEELFRLYGVTGTSYLRDGVASYYNGSWYTSASSSASYMGQYIEQTIDRYQDAEEFHFFVEFTSPTGGCLPSPQYTKQLIIDQGVVFYPESGLFSTTSGGVTGYNVVSVEYRFTETTLNDATPRLNPIYLQVPEALNTSILPLATRITENQKSTYGKVKALEQYLMASYRYDPSHSPAPDGVDPVAWFLFDSKQGECIDFNSALVLMARSIGVPSRLVTGYMVHPDAEYQAVRGRQTHAYAEVLFDGLGWIIFDATLGSEGEPPTTGGRIHTFTNITHQDEYVLVGSRFTVAGTVVDEEGSPVSGLRVLVYLKQNKMDPGVLVGVILVEDGLFNVSCLFPTGLEPGEYMVDAYTIGDETYIGSWSDPPIVSYMETGFIVQAPEEGITGRSFNITGVLTSKPANRTIPGALCFIEVDGQQFQAITNSDGRISLEASMERDGLHSLRLSWSGSGYYLGASTTMTVRSLPLGFTFTDTELVRGEASFFSGVVHAGELPGSFEALSAHVLEKEISTMTDEFGVFKIMCLVSNDHELGPISASLTIHSSQLSVDPSLTVKARPLLVITGNGPIQVNQACMLRLILLDDHESPISGGHIEVILRHGDDFKEYSLVTNEEGEASFEAKALKAEVGDLVYEARYGGSAEYLPSIVTGSLSVIPTQASPFSATLLALLMATGLGGLLFLMRHLNDKNKANIVSPPIDPAINSLRISFPNIEAPFPPVWGVNDELDICLRLTTSDGDPIPRGPIEITLPGALKHVLTDENGEATIKAIFVDKGDLNVSSEYPDGKIKASRPLRVVDYREEVVSLFNSKFQEARGRFKSVSDNYTARELMEYLKKKTIEASHSAIEEMVFLFEESRYSLHPIQREVYTRFYKAMLSYEEAV